MILDQFKILSIVAQTKSFSKAAKLLYLSQPAVSSKIQTLEDSLGVKLFTRTTHGVILTEAGKVVLDYSNRFLDLHQSMLDELNQLLNSNTQLVIGSSCTSGNYAMPSCINAFKENSPQVNIKLDISNSLETICKLNNREIDIAVVDGSIETNHAVHVLDSVDLVFVTANTDKSKKTKLTFKELKSKPFITREKGAAVRSVMDNLALQNGCTLDDFNIVTEMNSLHSIKAAVLKGIGITLLPLVAVQKEVSAGTLRILQIEDVALKIDVSLVYRTNEETSLVAQKFIKFLANPQNRGFFWEQ